MFFPIYLFGFKKNSETFALKCNIYFSLLYLNFKIVLQYIVHFNVQF